MCLESEKMCCCYNAFLIILLTGNRMMAQNVDYFLLKLSTDEQMNILTKLVLDYQIKFENVLKSVKDEMLEMKEIFTNLER